LPVWSLPTPTPPERGARRGHPGMAPQRAPCARTAVADEPRHAVPSPWSEPRLRAGAMCVTGDAVRSRACRVPSAVAARHPSAVDPSPGAACFPVPHDAVRPFSASTPTGSPSGHRAGIPALLLLAVPAGVERFLLLHAGRTQALPEHFLLADCRCGPTGFGESVEFVWMTLCTTGDALWTTQVRACAQPGAPPSPPVDHSSRGLGDRRLGWPACARSSVCPRP
jgi:hypothetical protein